MSSDLPSRPNLEYLKKRAKQALFFSRFEAGEFGHPSIDPEHVLLGMVRARFGAARLYAKSGLSLERIRADVGARRYASEPLSIAVIIAFSDETKRAVQFAAEEADRRHHDAIGTPHLLLGLLHDERSIASAILRDNGVTLEHVREVIQDLIDEETSA